MLFIFVKFYLSFIYLHIQPLSVVVIFSALNFTSHLYTHTYKHWLWVFHWLYFQFSHTITFYCGYHLFIFKLPYYNIIFISFIPVFTIPHISLLTVNTITVSMVQSVATHKFHSYSKQTLQHLLRALQLFCTYHVVFASTMLFALSSSTTFSLRWHPSITSIYFTLSMHWLFPAKCPTAKLKHKSYIIVKHILSSLSFHFELLQLQHLLYKQNFPTIW